VVHRHSLLGCHALLEGIFLSAASSVPDGSQILDIGHVVRREGCKLVIVDKKMISRVRERYETREQKTNADGEGGSVVSRAPDDELRSLAGWLESSLVCADVDT
jgi:hypothetical protein